MAAFVAEDPVGAGGETMKQSLGAKKVDVGECGKEKQAFDARGEADEVEEKLPAVLAGFELVELLDGVHPLHAELRLLGDRRDVFDSGERSGALVGIGNVVVEQGEIELHVHGLFKELPGEIEPRFGRVDVLVEVEHEVVGDDAVAGGEEGDQRWIRWTSAGVRRCLRSTRSV